MVAYWEIVIFGWFGRILFCLAEVASPAAQTRCAISWDKRCFLDILPRCFLWSFVKTHSAAVAHPVLEYSRARPASGRAAARSSSCRLCMKALLSPHLRAVDPKQLLWFSALCENRRLSTCRISLVCFYQLQSTSLPMHQQLRFRGGSARGCALQGRRERAHSGARASWWGAEESCFGKGRNNCFQLARDYCTELGGGS